MRLWRASRVTSCIPALVAKKPVAIEKDQQGDDHLPAVVAGFVNVLKTHGDSLEAQTKFSSQC